MHVSAKVSDTINIDLPPQRGITIFSSNEQLEMKLILDDSDELPVSQAQRKRKIELPQHKVAVQKKIARYISQKPIHRCLTPDISQSLFGMNHNEFYKIGDYRGPVSSFVTLQIGYELDDAIINAIAGHLIGHSNIPRVKLIDCLFMESPTGFGNRILADVEELETWKFYIMLNPGTT